MFSAKKKLFNVCIVPVVILALYVMITIFSQIFVRAAVDTTKVMYSKYLDDSETSWIKVYQDGVIEIVMSSKEAEPDNKVRYHTIGFGISTSPADAMTLEVGGEVYDGVKAPSRINWLELSNGTDLEGVARDGYVATQFTFTNEEIKDKLIGDVDFDNIDKTTNIYLNAIFSSYKLNTDGTETIRDGWISSWEEMMTAENWSVGTLEGFMKYYNISIPYYPGPQPVTMYFDYYDSTGNKIALSGSRDLTAVEIGTNIIMSDYSIDATRDGSASTTGVSYFEITKAYTEPKDSRAGEGYNNWKPDPQIYDTPEEVLAQILKQKAEVPYSGLNIHIEYHEIDPAKVLFNNYLFYQYEGSQRQAAKLASKKINETLTWSTEAKLVSPATVFGEGEYELQGYTILTADGSKAIDNRTRTDNITEAMLLNGSVKVVEGGLKVVLIYDKPGPSPTPTPPSVTPKPTIPPTELPEGGQEVKPMNIPEANGEIRSDVRGLERFNVLMGNPTTESLYAQVRGTEYILGYKLTKKTELITYPIKVTAIYHLKWTDAKNKTEIKTLDVPVEQIVDVERACAYWEIEQFDYYTLNRATVYNGALPGGKCTLYPLATYYKPPSLTITHSAKLEDHIIPPTQAKDGIRIDIYPPTGDGAKPVIPKDDFTYEANIGTDKIKVKSDYLAFNGRVIMDNSIYEFQAPALTNLSILGQEPILNNRDAMYQPNQIIPALTVNDVYYSTGTLTYYNHTSAVNSSGYTYDIMIKNLNNVIVHTPVICDASITTQNSSTGISTNDPYVQAMNVDSSCLQLVIDPENTLSDFTVDINNYGKHLYIPGYCTRDFAWGVRDPSVSYIAMKNSIYRNEVRFPFDVYIRRSSGDDTFIAKNTWIRFGFDTPTFYLPMWVDEGIYTVDFRTIAVNGVNTEDQLSRTQTYANTDRKNYVATDSIRVQVSGRLYGLTIYDVTDYPTWETVFRTADGSADFKINEGYPSGVTNAIFNAGYAYDYTVGTSNQYGIPTGRLNQYTVPLVNGSHPKYKNVGILKTGYSVKFKITATGNAFSSGDNIHIVPRFYYVDADGKNRREVDVYYTESFGGRNHNLVKMGSTLDQTNIKNYRCGDPFFGLPDNFLKIMADLASMNYSNYKWKTLELFTYTSIRMRWPLMAYTNIGYLTDVKNSSQLTAIRSAGITDTDIIKRMQTFYGEYYFPADIKAVEKGFDVYSYASKYGVGENEAFWLKGGYIIINFDIVTEDSNGNKNLSYINSVNAAKGYCSMWSMENPVTYKISYNGKRDRATEFNFLPGDFMVYYSDKSLHDDYVTYIVK